MRRTTFRWVVSSFYSFSQKVWNDNAGDKKPRPDVLKGRGCLSVAHLMNERAATGSDGVDASRTRARGDKPNAPSADEDVVGVSGKEVITVALVRGGRSRWKAKPAGAVTLTLSYTPPRCEQNRRISQNAC